MKLTTVADRSMVLRTNVSPLWPCLNPTDSSQVKLNHQPIPMSLSLNPADFELERILNWGAQKNTQRAK